MYVSPELAKRFHAAPELSNQDFGGVGLHLSPNCPICKTQEKVQVLGKTQLSSQYGNLKHHYLALLVCYRCDSRPWAVPSTDMEEPEEKPGGAACPNPHDMIRYSESHVEAERKQAQEQRYEIEALRAEVQKLHHELHYRAWNQTGPTPPSGMTPHEMMVAMTQLQTDMLTVLDSDLREDLHDRLAQSLGYVPFWISTQAELEGWEHKDQLRGQTIHKAKVQSEVGLKADERAELLHLEKFRYRRAWLTPRHDT